MAGILGIVGSPQASDVFPEMLRWARLYPWYETQVSESQVSESHLAACGLSGLGSCVTRGTQTLAFYGEIFNGQASPAEFLLEGLQSRGKDFLADVNGRYQAALWDESTQSLTLFCDHFATRPLYWTQTADGFLFAPQIKALLQCPTVNRSLNKEALIDFFTWGHYLHTYTSLQGIEVLPPAGFYTWNQSTGQLLRDRYFSFDGPENTSGSSAATIEEVAEAFRNSVLQQTVRMPIPNFGTEAEDEIYKGKPEDKEASKNDLSGLGISLSGGLDARSILAMIPSSLQENIISVALGVPGSADHRLASQLAQIASTHHFNYELNTDFLNHYDEHLTEMVRLTDGQYLSSAIVIPTLDFYREKGIQTLLRGHAGELFHMSKAYAFSMNETDRSTMADSRLSAKIWATQHLQAFMLEGVRSDLLLGIPRSECTKIAKDSLTRALEETGEEREKAIWKLYLNQRVFREIPLSMRKFDSHVNVRLPFLSPELAKAIFRLPTADRMGEKIQYFLLKKWRRDFLNVRNVNTGTYIGAWAFRQKIANLKQRVLAKLNVPGYQPYEKMGLWLRQELKPLVRELLLNGLRDRNIFHPDTITEVVQSHNMGKNHTYLILALMILEKQIRYFDQNSL